MHMYIYMYFNKMLLKKINQDNKNNKEKFRIKKYKVNIQFKD